MSGAVPDPSRALSDWLLQEGMDARPLDELVSRLADRLQAAGFPAARILIGGTILHPEYENFSVLWTPAGGVEHTDYPYGGNHESWLVSPLYRSVVEGHDLARYRLDHEAAETLFPIFGEFRAAGYTDYVVLTGFFGVDGAPSGSGFVASFATDRPGGFSEQELDILRRCRRPLAMAVRTATTNRVLRTVMTTYMGEDAARRVLSGDIRRGMVETIDAAILFADLRGFTLLADRIGRDPLVAMLDDYLDRMGEPVARHGGQILKFLGDGLLATFALDGLDRADACERAVAAAVEAIAGAADLNEARAARGEPTMALDVALHLGEVLYGNVGSRTRMEFTVIGPAVNEAARIEALCGELDCQLLASSAFVAAHGNAGRFRSVGAHQLRGVRRPQELFTLAEETMRRPAVQASKAVSG